MKQPHVQWESGSDDVGLLVSDTMMFQRGSPWTPRDHFSGFYGLAMPLVKHGIPVKCVVLDRVLDGNALKGVTCLLMSYEHMKPLKPEYNARLAEWVRAGGALVCFGDDSDPFHTVREWWNTGGNHDKSARHDLFNRLGVPSNAAGGAHAAGKGWLLYTKETPASLSTSAKGADRVIELLNNAMTRKSKTLRTANHICLHRGPFTVGAVMEESVSTAPLRIQGTFMNLFSSSLDIVTNPEIAPGNVFLFRRVETGAAPATPVLLGASARLELMEIVRPGLVRLRLTAPENGVDAICRIQLPDKPVRVLADGRELKSKWSWSAETHSVLINFSCSSAGTLIELQWNNHGAFFTQSSQVDAHRDRCADLHWRGPQSDVTSMNLPIKQSNPNGSDSQYEPALKAGCV